MSLTSLAQQLSALSAAERRAVLADLPPERLAALAKDWRFWARPNQLPPAHDTWRTWLVLAGRGFGKTRTGAEWIRACVTKHPRCRVALVAASYNEAREVMIEGESGLMAIAPDHARPRYEISRRRLLWPSGAQALVYSAEDADGLRGGQHHFAWCDELAKWPNTEAVWMNLQMGLRLGKHPRACVTTTPRPIGLIKKMLVAERAIVARGRMHDNLAALPADFVLSLERAYAGTRMGRQEIDGDFIEDIEGALFSRALMDACHVDSVPELMRVVVAVDPPVSHSATADACGIVAAGIAADGHVYVLADASLQGASPEHWARVAVDVAARVGADRIVAEVNNGGDLVGSVLRAQNAVLPLKLVRASRGKVARAEPVAALYERGHVHHARAFSALEDELCGLQIGGGYAGATRSPDRADALVWAVTELALGALAAVPQLRSL